MKLRERLDERTRQVKGRNGKLFGILEAGASDGYPIFLLHGSPGSRVSALSFEAPAMEHGVRLLGVDRPGIGLSSFQEGYGFVDLPGDIEHIADEMGLDKFSVLGVSGGGPYAWACGVQIPHRLNSIALLAGMGPFEMGIENMGKNNQTYFSIAKNATWFLRFLYWFGIVRKQKDIKKLRKILPQMAKGLPEPDKQALLSEELQQMVALELQEGFRQGAKRQAIELSLYTKPWGFRPEDVPGTLPVYLWHGEQDENVPVDMSQKMVALIPQIQAVFDSDEGHLSILPKYIGDALSSLKQTGR